MFLITTVTSDLFSSCFDIPCDSGGHWWDNMLPALAFRQMHVLCSLRCFPCQLCIRRTANQLLWQMPFARTSEQQWFLLCQPCNGFTWVWWLMTAGRMRTPLAGRIQWHVLQWGSPLSRRLRDSWGLMTQRWLKKGLSSKPQIQNAKGREGVQLSQVAFLLLRINILLSDWQYFAVKKMITLFSLCPYCQSVSYCAAFRSADGW